jgi:hypothetical protein
MPRNLIELTGKASLIELQARLSIPQERLEKQPFDDKKVGKSTVNRVNLCKKKPQKAFIGQPTFDFREIVEGK